MVIRARTVSRALRSHRRTLIASLLCTAICGCAPATPSLTGVGGASPTPTPLGGTPLSTAEFATVVPTGWSNRIDDSAEVQKFSANGAVEYLVEQGPPGQVQQNVNDVTANINVVLLSIPVPDDQVATYLESVESSGATNLSTPRPFTIDGTTGQSITYDRDIQGTPGESEDMVVSHGGNTFDIVLNTSQFAFPTQQAGLQAVLAAWHWRE